MVSKKMMVAPTAVTKTRNKMSVILRAKKIIKPEKPPGFTCEPWLMTGHSLYLPRALSSLSLLE